MVATVFEGTLHHMSIRYKRVGMVHHGQLQAAIEFAAGMERLLRKLGVAVWSAPATDEQGIRQQASEADLILSIGGDGTLLRAARAVADFGLPLVGINLGRLGFMAELTATDACDKLPHILAGEGWTDIRAMLSVRVDGQQKSHLALNEVVVARRSLARMIRVQARVDGELLAEYRVDGLIVSTATGSTGYALAAGGPVLHPQSRDMLIQPICPHLSFARCLIVPASAIIVLTTFTEHQAMLSTDGQMDLPLKSGDSVTLHLSDVVVRFLRLHPPSYFYGSLTQRLKGEHLH